MSHWDLQSCSVLLKGFIVQHLAGFWDAHRIVSPQALICDVLNDERCIYSELRGISYGWICFNEGISYADRLGSSSQHHTHNPLNIISHSCLTRCLFFISPCSGQSAAMAVSHIVPRSVRSCVNNSKAAHLKYKVGQQGSWTPAIIQEVGSTHTRDFTH